MARADYVVGLGGAPWLMRRVLRLTRSVVGDCDLVVLVVPRRGRCAE